MTNPPSWVSWSKGAVYEDPLRESAPVWVRAVYVLDMLLVGFLLALAASAGYRDNFFVIVPVWLVMMSAPAWVGALLWHRARAGARGAFAGIAGLVFWFSFVLPGLAFPSGSPADRVARDAFFWLGLLGMVNAAVCLWALVTAVREEKVRQTVVGFLVMWGWVAFAVVFGLDGK